MRAKGKDVERLRDEFPSMPEEIRQMVAREVRRQINGLPQEQTEQQREDRAEGQTAAFTGNRAGWEDGQAGRGAGQSRETKRRGRNRRRTIIFIAASVAVLGTTVMAGVKLGLSFSTKQVGEYGLEISVREQEDKGTSRAGDGSGISGTDTPEAVSKSAQALSEQASPSASSAAWQAPEEVPEVKIEASYIPEGMVSYDDGLKIGYEDSLWQGGISMTTVVMDEEGMDGSMLLTDVVGSEQITVGDHEGVYVEFVEDSGEDGASRPVFNRRIYVMYPEVWQILEMFVASDVSREDALAVAAGISLVPTGETTPMDEVYATWSDEPDVMIIDSKVTADREELTISQIGESFLLEAAGQNDQGDSIDVPLQVKVTSVELSDRLDLLRDWQTSPYVDDTWREAADSEGVLQPDEIRFVKGGDGIATVDQVIKTEQVGQKLLYVTAEYTNTGEEAANNVLFGACVMSLLEEGDTFTIYDRAKAEPGDWDWTEQSGPAGHKEMGYWDVRSADGVNNGSNYIPSIQPGETVTVHLGWIVNEDELGYLYLDLSGSGNGINFPTPERGARQGALLVDARQ